MREILPSEWPTGVTKKDLRIETKRGSGNGGQNRNKRETFVVITHIPTGIVGQSQDQRTQGQNMKTAFRRLAEKLIPIMKNEVQKQRFLAGKEIIRTYHKPDQRVIDKRLPNKQWAFDDVLDGDGLGKIIETLLKERGAVSAFSPKKVTVNE